MAQYERIEGGNRNMNGNDVTNIGTGANAVPSLAVALANLKAQSAGSAVWQFVGVPADRSIAQLPFTTSTVFNQPGYAVPAYGRNNTFGAAFDNNVVAVSGFNNNSFGFNCTQSTYAASFAGNKLANGVALCTFEEFVQSNDLNDNCQSIVLRSNCNNNKFNRQVHHFEMGSYCHHNEVTSSSYVKMGANCSNVRVENCVGTAAAPFLIPERSINVLYKDNQLQSDPYNVGGKLDKVANLGDVASKSASRRNLGLTDENDRLLAALLPGYVDEVANFPSKTGFPATGEKGVLYTTDDDLNGQWRWVGGTGGDPVGYRRYATSPGTTDDVPEATGGTNRYFTNARALAAVLTGYAKSAATATAELALKATDSVLVAFGKVEQRLELVEAAAAAGTRPVTETTPVAVTDYTVTHNLGRYVKVDVYNGNNDLIDVAVHQAVDLMSFSVGLNQATVLHIVYS